MHSSHFARPLAALAALLSVAGLAQAGDAVARRVFGFSPDGDARAFHAGPNRRFMAVTQRLPRS